MPKPSRDLAVGAMFSLALVILALGVMAVGGDSGLFFARSEYRIRFPTTDGLLVGAPVRIAGVEVGTVSGVALPTDPGRVGIEVGVQIDSAYAERVREDSTAALRILQMLTNEKFVEIIPGSLDKAELASGSEIPTLHEPEFFERGEAIAENLNEVAVSLRQILGSLERGDGLIGQMLSEPDFGQEGLESLRGTLDNAEELTRGLLEGRGTLGRLLKDDEVSGTLDELRVAVEGFASLMETMGRQEGALGEMIRDDGAGERMIADASGAAAAMLRLTERLESNEGFAGRLLNDTEYSEALAADLRSTLHNVAEITDKINRGEGTLGALVNERVLYDGAEDVIAGVDDSKFARWLLRHYRKKGVKSQEKQRNQEQKSGKPDP